jgi:hypothetical protein
MSAKSRHYRPAHGKRRAIAKGAFGRRYDHGKIVESGRGSRRLEISTQEKRDSVGDDESSRGKAPARIVRQRSEHAGWQLLARVKRLLS